MRRQKPMSFDDLLKDLQGQNASQEDSNEVALEKLFSTSFMSKHSNSKSFEAFMEKGNFQAKTRADIQNLSDELLDRHIARETSFSDWSSMLEAATEEWNTNQQE